MTTTVVIDISVFIHDLVVKMQNIDRKDQHWTGLIKAQVDYMLSGVWLGDLGGEDLNFIIVQDTKPYWRSAYLLDPFVYSQVPRKTKAAEKVRAQFNEMLLANGAVIDTEECKKLAAKLEIHYKAGRKFPTYELTKIKNFLLGHHNGKEWKRGYLDHIGVPVLYKKGYEADDWAATVVQVNSESTNPHVVYLVTTDSDWSGLISNRVTWFCMHGWPPRVRGDLYSLQCWTKRRLGVTILEHREIWQLKGIQGDKSDNLPPSQGVLMPVIDLLNPPDEFKLWLQPDSRERALQALASPIRYGTDASSAINYIRKQGVALSIRPLDNKRDFIV